MNFKPGNVIEIISPSDVDLQIFKFDNEKLLQKNLFNFNIDDFVGETGFIVETNPNGARIEFFNPDISYIAEDYYFPFGCLEHSNEVKYLNTDFKYQYLFFDRKNEYCITIASRKIKFNDGHFGIEYSASFKNPNDIFNKIIARHYASSNHRTVIEIPEKIEHKKILLKILCDLLNNPVLKYSKEYEHCIMLKISDLSYGCTIVKATTLKKFLE